jgi:hypothetical protein
VFDGEYVVPFAYARVPAWGDVFEEVIAISDRFVLLSYQRIVVFGTHYGL